MADNPNFDRRAARHVVINRVAGGRWQERARFADVADAGNFAIRLQQATDAANAVGFETMVILDDPLPESTEHIHPTRADATSARRPTDDLDATDRRVPSWPHFDA